MTGLDAITCYNYIFTSASVGTTYTVNYTWSDDGVPQNILTKSREYIIVKTILPTFHSFEDDALVTDGETTTVEPTSADNYYTIPKAVFYDTFAGYQYLEPDGGVLTFNTNAVEDTTFTYFFTFNDP